MTQEEQQVIDLQFQRLMTAIENQAKQQELKDKNIMMHMTGLSAQIEAQGDLLTLTAENDRKILIETKNNTIDACNRITELESTRNDHIINCPRITDIRILDKKIEDVKLSIQDITFIQRHPGLFLTLIIASILIGLIGLAK